MSISALTSTSTASQLSFLSRLSSTNSSSSISDAEGVRRPPPPDGGGFAEAIAEALKSIGIADTDSAATSTASASADSTETTEATDVAAALGSFLQSLMGALHAQNSEGIEAPPPYGEQQGGPGKPATDLQSLIAELTSGSADASADSSDAVGDLESAFANLLDKLGVSGDTGSTDATDSTTGADGTDTSAKLAAFLQALSSKVGGKGMSGNLVNTTV